MLLKGEEGYYCPPEVEFGGEKFKVRELEDLEAETWDQGAQELIQLQTEAARISERMSPQPGKPFRAPNEKDLGRLNEVGRKITGITQRQTDFLVSHGLVAWSLEQDCTPENALRLPPVVKAALAERIAKDTTLTFGEADFLAGSPTPSAEAKP